MICNIYSESVGSFWSGHREQSCSKIHIIQSSSYTLKITRWVSTKRAHLHLPTDTHRNKIVVDDGKNESFCFSDIMDLGSQCCWASILLKAFGEILKLLTHHFHPSHSLKFAQFSIEITNHASLKQKWPCCFLDENKFLAISLSQEAEAKEKMTTKTLVYLRESFLYLCANQELNNSKAKVYCDANWT